MSSNPFSTPASFASYEDFVRDFSLSVPDGFNFAFDFFDAKAKAAPDELAMIHIGPDGERRDLTYGQLNDASSALAWGLTRAGLGKGDRVMVILYRRVEFWETMLALHKIGAVAVPSPSLLTPKDIEFRVGYAGIKGAVVEDSVAGRVEEARRACPSLKVVVQAGPSPLMPGWLGYEDLCRDLSDYPRPGDAAGGDEPMLIYFTSGTTGMPKMVEHPHTYPLGHYVTGVYWHDLKPGDIHLTLADTGWGKAVWGKFYGQWLAGAAVFVWDFRGKFEPSALLDVLAAHKVTTFCAPPTVYRFLIREDLAKWDLTSLRHCTTAGELLNDSVFLAWEKATGLPIFEGYGQTETTLQIATYPHMRPKPGSIGRPSPGWRIVLLDEDGKPCDTGVEGEICVDLSKGRPLGLFSGYMDEPAKTAAAMDGGYYHTGDKAWMDEDGYLWFLGRADDLIKSSGYRIGPFEVESALITHPAVVEAAVTGAPDPLRGQLVKATVVLAPNFEPSDELTRDIQEHVKRVTAPYKYPRVIEYLPELPKTISGKIKRAEIRRGDEAKLADLPE